MLYYNVLEIIVVLSCKQSLQHLFLPSKKNKKCVITGKPIFRRTFLSKLNLSEAVNLNPCGFKQFWKLR